MAGPAPVLIALLKPRLNRPRDQDEICEVIARTGNGKATILLHGRTFAVEMWRLYSTTDRRQRLAATDLAGLPWNGKGKDPLKAHSRHPERSEAKSRDLSCGSDQKKGPSAVALADASAGLGMTGGDYETAVSRPPQDEDGTAIERNA